MMTISWLAIIKMMILLSCVLISKDAKIIQILYVNLQAKLIYFKANFKFYQYSVYQMKLIFQNTIKIQEAYYLNRLELIISLVK